MWNDLTDRKRAGYAHDVALAEAASPGSLALFCPACPQPGINLPPGWEDEPEQWRYTRCINMDGNFKADHIAMDTPDDVYLADGLGYWVGKDQYASHITTAYAKQQVQIFPDFSNCLELTVI